MNENKTTTITLDAQDFILDLSSNYDIEVTLRTIDDVAELAYYYKKYTHGDSFKTGFFSATNPFDKTVYGVEFEYDEYEDIVVATIYQTKN